MVLLGIFSSAQFVIILPKELKLAMNTEIYLDANATSAVLPAAIRAAELAMRDFYGNPSSGHVTGMQAKSLLEAVRLRACRLLGVQGGRLCFTSGATEGIQTAVLSALCAIRARRAAGELTGDLLVYGTTEHKAVPESLAHWNSVLGLGLELRALPVDRTGRHRLDCLAEMAPRAALVCTMAANNETGVISDLDGIAKVLAQTASRAYWMVDSVQALGKIALNLAATRIDYAPFSGHKLYAPKGIGMLYVREGAPYTALMAGGGQEDGLRAGTENMAGVAALGAVLEALEDQHSFSPHAQLLLFREQLAAALRAALPGVLFNAPFENTLATTLNFSVPGFSSRELLDLFDAAGVRVSSGSACSSSKAAPSYVLEAMHVPHWRCAAAIRMSFGPMVNAAFIDAACARIAHCGAALRASGLIASDQCVVRGDGVVQFVGDGHCTWLVLDAPSRSCAIIDPSAALAARVAQFVRCQTVLVRAVVDTHVHAGGAGRIAQLAALGEPPDHGADGLGWPKLSEPVQLANGAQVEAIALGERMLVRLARCDGANQAVSYLLGQPASAGAMRSDEVRFAFTGAALAPGLLDVAGAQTILCSAHDAGQLACTTLAAERGEIKCEGQGQGQGQALEHALAGPGLNQFLDAHPDALLIDVREAYERAASGVTQWQGHATASVPLSRLAERLADWLRDEHRPLVFFCRSGGRSAKAAQCLQRLGYQNAWHVRGALPV
jgi:cysteine sulfinate desulfinase/cysteine desulfurase-like protein/rhodanese-related sulfurtransferase